MSISMKMKTFYHLLKNIPSGHKSEFWTELKVHYFQ